MMEFPYTVTVACARCGKSGEARRMMVELSNGLGAPDGGFGPELSVAGVTVWVHDCILDPQEVGTRLSEIEDP